MVGKNNGKHGRRRNAMNSMRTSHIPRGLGGRTISLISNGICGLPSSSPCTQGRRTIPGLRWIIWAGRAGVISKLRMRVKMMYFILWDFPGKRYPALFEREGRDKGTHSRVPKWYPMHALEPPRKLMMLPHTPGRACAPGGMFSQRSGLNGISSEP